MPETPPPAAPSAYRLALPLAVRMLGAALIGAAGLMGSLAVLVVASGWPGGVLVAAMLVVVAGLGALWWLLRRVAYVLRLDADGYRVGLLRGAGVRRAGWREVTEVATTTSEGVALLVLELGDDRRTTVPVSALAGDREQLVRDVQRRLDQGRGLRPWNGVGEPGGPDS